MDAKSRHHWRKLSTDFGKPRAFSDVHQYLRIGYEASHKTPDPSCSREPRLAAEFNSWTHSYRPRHREIRQKSTTKLTKLACTHTHPYIMLHTMRIDTLVGVSFPHWVLAIAERLASPLTQLGGQHTAKIRRKSKKEKTPPPTHAKHTPSRISQRQRTGSKLTAAQTQTEYKNKTTPTHEQTDRKINK